MTFCLLKLCSVTFTLVTSSVTVLCCCHNFFMILSMLQALRSSLCRFLLLIECLLNFRPDQLTAVCWRSVCAQLTFQIVLLPTFSSFLAAFQNFCCSFPSLLHMFKWFCHWH